MANSYVSEQSRQAARERIERQGLSLVEFANRHELNPQTVYNVLGGHKKCLRGEAHRAAVLLGIKEGTIDSTPSPVAG